MIYLTDGNMPLNNAYWDKISQEDGITYQLTFRFPTSDPLWERLKEETFLIADDLHGEQDFVIFEVEKKQGYIQIYANQVFTLLNNFVTGPISLDRVTGTTALSRFAGAITRDNPFSFFSDISERHTFNTETKNAMQVFAKDKHSILGQWGGDLVRHGYQVRLLKNGGSENESLFMYKKNLSSYQHKTSTKSLKTRITFKTTVKGEGENAPDRKFSVVVDSPLINKYSQIYEDVIEVNDQDVKDEASLRKYGEQYFKTSLCDMMEDSLELEVVGQSDVPVQMYDIVSLFHEVYDLDVRKKITKYTYSPMAKKLLSIGFGQFKSGLANAIGNAVSDAVRGEAQQLHDDFEKQLERELKNADLAFEHQKEELVNQFTDGLNAAKAKAEEVKAAMTEQLNLKINQSKSEVTDRLQKEFDQKLSSASADLAGVRANLTQAQSRFSGDISQIQSDIAAIRGKQYQADSELAKQVQSINQTKSELAGVKTNLTQAQSQLTSNIAQIRSDVGDIRTKQSQAETEISKQVQALNATKTELAGVKSAQANYEQTTTRRLAELANVAGGKASKSELVQTAQELSSRIASVQVGGTNLYALSKNSDIWKGGHVADFQMDISSGEISFKTTGLDPYVGEATTHPRTASNRNGVRIPVISGKSIYVTISNPVFAKNFISYFDENGNTVKHYQYYNTNSFMILPKELAGVSFITLRFGCGGSNFEIGDVLKTKIKVEYGTIPTDWSPAPEDQDERVSAVESSFKQRADSLEAGVSSLREGLKTKADTSALTLLSDRILASVKSLETDMDNKLDSKLSTAQFEVQASGIRQEIVNATKDKADKALVTAEAGRLREELASLSVGGRNLLKGSKGPFKPNRNPANFDNNTLYSQETSVYLVQNEKYRISAKTDGNFSSSHTPNNENDNVVLWLMDKAVANYQIVSDAKTGTTGTEFVWNRPTGTYHLRVNTYRKDHQKLKSVWEVKVEQGSFKTDWSPALEDTDGLITEAKATFERTAQGLRTDLMAVQAYVNADGTRAEALLTHSREETARQLTAERKLIEAGYVAKAQHTEDVRSISRRFEELKNSSETKLAEYKQGIDGQLASVQAALNTANGSLTNFNNWKQSAQETLNKVGRVETGLNETKTSLAEFKRTAEGQLTTITQQVAGKASQTEFKQRADSLEASVSSLSEGLKSKADSSALNLLSDSIKQSVKSLETDTQNKLDSKLSTTEFEVRASGIRQEIVNATKDKADKALVTAEAGKLREELASLSVGGRNLALGTSKEWSTPFTSFTGNPNICPQLYKVLTDGLQVGDTLRSKIILKYTDVRPATGKTATVWLQGNGNVTGWTAGAYGGSPAKTLNGSGEITFEHSFKITENHLKNAYWNWMFRTDFIASGSLQWKLAKVESGSVFTSWSPAPEDAEGLITEAKATFERTAQGLRTDLTAVQAYVSTDGTRSEALLTHSREETARQLTTLRQIVESGYVAKDQHTEDVRSVSRRFEELKTSSETKLAKYRQTVEGQFATMSSRIGESLKKTDISITPGQITLGTGKVVNGQTLASLFVQNPESMQAITKLMRITGDLIVDGSITGRDLAAGAITTPHLAAGAVTAEVLGANAVTADKVKADDALLEKLTAGEALLRKLMAKDAFINRLQSIDFAAEQIKGGLLRSIDGSLIFDLNKNTLTMSSNTAAIKRVLPGHPTQFMRYETERKGNVDYTRTIIGSNRNGSEKFDSVTFAGLVVENSNKAGIEDSLRLYGDNTYFRHAQGEVGWNINAVTQRMSPATWQKESAIWSRSFVVPKHRTPNSRDWVKLEETVAALWRLWEHAAGNQVTMTGAMRDKVRELFQNYGYNYGIS